MDASSLQLVLIWEGKSEILGIYCYSTAVVAAMVWLGERSAMSLVANSAVFRSSSMLFSLGAGGLLGL